MAWRQVHGGNRAINSSQNNTEIVIHPFFEHD